MFWYAFAILMLVLAGICVLSGLLKAGKRGREAAGWTEPNVLPTRANR